MNDDIAKLLQKYKNKGGLIDANLLLLYFMGLCEKQAIPRFKRTQRYTIEDFTTLSSLADYFTLLVTTPHILTEVSNLAGQLTDNLRWNYFDIFARGVTFLEEHYVPSVDIVKDQAFKKLGVTDVGILQLVKGKYLVITDDFRLSQYLQKQGVDVLNFNHIRTFFWKR